MAETTAHKPFASLTGLCVEDEPLVSLEMSKTLTEVGIGKVLTAHRLSSAFQHLEQSKIDIALLDYDLGFGERTTELGLKLADLGAKVVFSSGYDISELDPRLHEFVFIEKPARPGFIAETITKILTEAEDVKKAGP